MVYTTAARVKEDARITFDQLGFANDAAYVTYITDTLIPAIESVIDTFVGHDFNVGAGTFTLDGTGKETLHITRHGLVGALPPHLLPLPLRGVTVVTIDGATATIADIKVYNSFLVYDCGIFCEGRQNVVVTATWGYAAVPTDVAFVATQACANALRNMLKRWIAPQEITRIIMGGRSTGGMRGFYAEDVTLTESLKDVLRQYKFF